MVAPRLDRVLFGALIAWAVFGSWSLFRPAGGGVDGLDPLVGHFVVFFFVSLAALGLATMHWGSGKGVVLGVALVGASAVVSEGLQPVLTETRRAELVDLSGNALGIFGASILTGLLIAVLGHTSRRSWVTASLCLIGLVASAGVTAYGFDAVRHSLECRDAGYEPMDEIEGGPIIEVRGDVVRLGDTSPVPLGDGEISDDSTDLRCSAFDGNAYTIVATVVPESVRSNGPARIFTSSAGTSSDQFNTHIGQDFERLSVRVRSGSSRRSMSVPDVFSAGTRVTVALAVGDGEAVIFVDGREREVFELKTSSLSSWDPTFPILVGDEATRDRTFRGDIEQVSVYDRALRAGDPLLG